MNGIFWMAVLDLCSTFLCATLLIRYVCVSGLTSLWSLLVMEYGKKKSYLKRCSEFNEVYFCKGGDVHLCGISIALYTISLFIFSFIKECERKSRSCGFCGRQTTRTEKEQSTQPHKDLWRGKHASAGHELFQFITVHNVAWLLNKEQKVEWPTWLTDFSRAFLRTSSLLTILIGSFHKSRTCDWMLLLRSRKLYPDVTSCFVGGLTDFSAVLVGTRARKTAWNTIAFRFLFFL